MANEDGTAARFTQTHWTVIIAAAKTGEGGANVAMEDLCRRYWYPVYAFVRRQGCSPHDAQDATQGFFADLLRRPQWLAGVAPEKGKFRTFLLACLKNYLNNQRDRAHGPTRNPGQPIISIDAEQAEDRYKLEPSDPDDPARAFERRWAFTLVEQVLAGLKASCAAEGKAEMFDVLCPGLTGEAERGDFAAVAAKLSLSEGAARVAATRLRARFRELLREEIARTVDRPEDVDGEISYLFALFGR